VHPLEVTNHLLEESRAKSPPRLGNIQLKIAQQPFEGELERLQNELEQREQHIVQLALQNDTGRRQMSEMRLKSQEELSEAKQGIVDKEWSLATCQRELAKKEEELFFLRATVRRMQEMLSSHRREMDDTERVLNLTREELRSKATELHLMAQKFELDIKKFAMVSGGQQDQVALMTASKTAKEASTTAKEASAREQDQAQLRQEIKSTEAAVGENQVAFVATAARQEELVTLRGIVQRTDQETVRLESEIALLRESNADLQGQIRQKREEMTLISEDAESVLKDQIYLTQYAQKRAAACESQGAEMRQHIDSLEGQLRLTRDSFEEQLRTSAAAFESQGAEMRRHIDSLEGELRQTRDSFEEQLRMTNQAHKSAAGAAAAKDAEMEALKNNLGTFLNSLLALLLLC
jgi:chromosome segregation ATPase